MGTVDPMSRGAVLVVDDDEGLRAELRSTLEAEGYFVIEASDGREALDFLHTSAGAAVRLMVLDLVMPCMSGWELVDLLRLDQGLSHLPVLVASATPVHGDASGIGATMHWLRKPFDEGRFLDAVREGIRAAQVIHAADDDDIGPSSARSALPSYHDA